MKKNSVRLVITSGEPAGIGPQVSYRAAQQFLHDFEDVTIDILGDQQLFQPYLTGHTFGHGVRLEHVPLCATNRLGNLNVKNAPYVLSLLDKAYTACHEQRYDAMVTAPLQKSVINQSGINFTGHTEYLAQKAGIAKVVMMLCAELHPPLTQDAVMMRVALVSTHVALQDVSAQMNTQDIVETLAIIQKSCRTYFGLQQPKIAVAGLNPHAGEDGYLGTEEIKCITPAILQAQTLGINASGPFPADTLFRYSALNDIDVFLAMYHDQGLIPLKMASFGRGVNITLGLPMIRTSVDHGTALDRAQTGDVDFMSMYQALKVAYQMVKNGASST